MLVDDAPDGLWDQAYAILKDDQPELIAAYESALSAHGRNESEQQTIQPSQLSATDREARLTIVLTDKTNAAISARMKINFWPGKRVAVRDCFDNIVKKIIVAEGFIGQAVSGEPHAALAWAGVSMLLPVSFYPGIFAVGLTMLGGLLVLLCCIAQHRYSNATGGPS